MNKKLKILFVPLEGVGHVNSCISLAQELIRNGHEVLLAISEKWKGRIEKYGIQEVFIKPEEDNNTEDDPAKHLGAKLIQSGNISDRTPLEKALRRAKPMHTRIDFYMKLDKIVEQLLSDICPDVIICDQFFTIPSVVNSGIPWVWCWSPGPLSLYTTEMDMPPPASGMSTLSDKNEWKTYKNAVKEVMFEPWNRYNEYMISRGAPPLRKYAFTNGSPYLNVYGFPEELDYEERSLLPKNYIRFDNLMRREVDDIDFEIPEQLKNKPGKLIYFSMGSMGGADIELMKRLIAILAKSEHRFIVSKGPLHDKFELADNMWGQQSVPQIKVISIVDLVITHAGNNTVCETFFYGKPMIALPLFGDQYDNAQRIHDKGFGIRLETYRCTEDQLLNAIERLLYDKQLKEKLKTISKRIQSDNSIAKFSQLVQNLVK